MKMLLCVGLLAAALVVVGHVAAGDKPKNDITTIMEMAHKGGQASLKAKVAGLRGEKADAEKLLALYEDLSKNDPPKGEKADWKKRTDALVAAARKLAADPKDRAAAAALNRAAMCKSCHDVHQP
jgi:hypothetical protein